MVSNGGWEGYKLFILRVVPNQTKSFIALYSLRVLTPELIAVLNELNKYYITLVEQFYLDHLKPSFNMQPYANASSYNAGGTGLVRDEEFRTNLSLKHIGRQYSDNSKEIWRSNKLGSTRSKKTRARISLSHGGVITYVLDVQSKDLKSFMTKSAAADYLGISLRTLTRWASNSNQVRTTKVGKTVRLSFTTL